MALREFRDEKGHRWRVWNVAPQVPLWMSGVAAGEAEPTGAAAVLAARKRLTPGLEQGWLCFENDTEKRRLSPIPAGWAEAPETELRRMCADARAVRATPA
jgi:hypothetical protein